MMKFLVVLPLLLISFAAQAEEYSPKRMTSAEEAMFKEQLNNPDMLYLQEFIDDCIAYIERSPPRKRSDPVVIGMPCEPHESSRVGGSMQEMGIDRFKGRFLVLNIKQLRNNEEVEEDSAQWFYNGTHAQMVMIMSNLEPYPIFSFVQVFLYSTPEEKNWDNISLMGVYEITDSYTEEQRKRMIAEVSYYLFSDEWTL